MANIKITELNAAGSLAANDVLPVVDISTDETKKITSANLFRTLPDGTAAAPSLSFGSDPANGIFLASSDTVGISTGGTQRVTVDASGNVVISGDLTVQGATTTVESTTVTIDDKNIELGSVASPSNTTADGGGITLKGASDKTIKWINSTGCWTFNQPTNFNDHVRIDSSGKVGIGTASPSQLLEVRGSSNIMARFRDSTNGIIDLRTTGSTNSDPVQIDAQNRELSFAFNSTEAMRIDTSGNLGVGTSSPGQLLHLNSSASTAIQISDGTNNQFISSIKTAGNFANGSTAGDLLIRGQSGFAVSPNNGSSVALRVGSSGNVGIGASSPAAKLDIAGNQLFSAANPQIQFNGGGPIIRLPSANTLAFLTDSSTERMRINSSGNVAIGSTSPEFKFMVADAGYSGIEIKSNRTGATENIGGLHFKTVSTSVAYIQSLVDGTLKFRNTSSLTERMRIDTSGRVGIGTSSPTSPLTVKSNSSSATDSGLSIQANGNTNNIIAMGEKSTDGGRFHMYDGGVEKIAFYSDGTANHISAGNFGIGTSSPDQLAHIHKTSGSTIYKASVAGNSTVGLEIAKTGSTTQSWRIVDGQTVNGKLEFYDVTDSATRMCIDGSGNVGIGTSSPIAELHVKASDTNCIVKIENTTGAGLIQQNGNDFNINNLESGNMRFYTADTERMRIDSSGRLLLGLSSSIGADALLQVQGSGNRKAHFHQPDTGSCVTQFTNSVTGTNTGDGFLVGLDSTEDGMLWLYENKNITFATNNSERMRIDSSGRVAIGVTNPGHQLTVRGAGSNTAIANFFGGTVGRGLVISTDNDGGVGDDTVIYNATQNSGSHVFQVDASEKVRIGSSGRVGIGTTSPANNLDIAVDSNNEGIRISSSTNVFGKIDFHANRSGADAALGILDFNWNNTQVARIIGGTGTDTTNKDDGVLQFHTAAAGSATERMRIDSSGRLLLGTTTEGLADGDNLTIADSGACGITLRSGSSSGGAIYFSDATSGSGEYAGFVEYLHNSNALRFASGGTERFRITSTGAFAIEGASNYGTSGQVLTSNGNDAPTWQSAGQASIGGANVISMNDNVNINFGASNDLQIYHDGSNSYVSDTATGNLFITTNGPTIQLTKGNSENMAVFRTDGSVDLYYNNSKKFETKSNGVDITGELQCDSLDCDGGADFTGDAVFRGGSAAVNIAGSSDIRFINGDWTGNTTSPKIQAHSNYLYIVGGSSGIIFREDGTDRCRIDTNGHFRPATTNTYDLGTSSVRWRNVYTNDLNLSNEGSTNDVDGTWGNYTIQEGEDDLFLINRRNGKKYKFNLTEVS